MWLQRHGGGNPARCVALMRLLLQRGAIHYVNGTFELPYDLAYDSLEQDLKQASDLSTRTMSAEAREAAGIGDGLLRLSVGIEDARDLAADIDAALERSARSAGALAV